MQERGVEVVGNVVSEALAKNRQPILQTTDERAAAYRGRGMLLAVIRFESITN